MAKTFYTELDIELLFKQGVTSLVVNEDVVLTELAREKAERLVAYYLFCNFGRQKNVGQV